MDLIAKEIEVRLCLNCGKKLYGRRDKKYCHNYCRTEYHNRNKPLAQRYILEVSSVCRLNRKILKTLCPEGRTMVGKEVLDRMGYDYRFFSSTYICKESNASYYVCFDYAFAPICEGKIQLAMIIHNPDFSDELMADPWSAGKDVV